LVFSFVVFVCLFWLCNCQLCCWDCAMHNSC
jgi:hypothetical protein